MISVVRAIGTLLEKVGLSLQAMTAEEIMCWISIMVAFFVAVTLAAALIAIVLDWWEIAGRYRMAVFVKDRTADFKEWKDNRARLKRLKAAHRANFDNKRR